LRLAFQTPRLIAVAATAEIARADASDRAAFGRLLEARVTAEWPIEVMRDVTEHFAHQLETGAVSPGFATWYLLKAEDRELVGVAGYYGAPDADGWTMIGYSVCPSAEGNGYATEALSGLMAWGNETGKVRGWRATTFERHWGSIRVLEKNGFARVGVSPEDAQAAENDRQGRGSLMLWERENAGVSRP